MDDNEIKNILIICVENVEEYPPVSTLCRALLTLGHRVTLACYHGEAVTRDLTESTLFTIINLGSRNSGGFRSLVCDYRTRKKIKGILKAANPSFDIVWTTTDLAARDCGKALTNGSFDHVMQLMELVEDVPAITRRFSLPIKSSFVKKMAQESKCVVVPEYNRSFIQQALWRLPSRPTVLPNKPLSVSRAQPVDSTYSEYLELMSQDKRRILLYQGVFTPDRSLKGFIDTADILGENYAIYLMGLRDDNVGRSIRRLIQSRENIVPIPFVPAPQHLAFTQHASIGLLPYRPAYDGRQSPLNALYCAPNKIWEYSRFGLPMIGSEVPGLTTTFERNGIGLTCDIDDPSAIVEAVHRIEADYDAYSSRSRAYFDSVDVVEIVRDILEGK